MAQRPTLRQVAARTGVSIATVSRVVRGVGEVSPETRRKVMEAIEELGFRPSHLGQALVKQRHATLGIVFPGLAGPYYSEVIHGFEAEAVEASHSLLILGTHLLAQSDDLTLDLAARADGLAIMGGSVSDDVVRRLVGWQYPLVLLASAPRADVPTVRVDNASAMEHLVTHLLADHGYRRLAFIGDPTGSPDTMERWQAFVRAHNLAGLRPPRAPARIGLTQADGLVAARELLAGDPPPRAMVCANDETALGAYIAVVGRGLVVPDDVAITGFDDVPTSGLVAPGLTTIRQPMRELGAQTARLLLQRVDDGGDPSVDLVLPTELVLRESCGCAPSSPTEQPSDDTRTTRPRPPHRR